MEIAAQAASIAPKILDGTQDGPLGKILDLVGGAAKLTELLGGPGDIVESLLESAGLPDEIASLVGIATDVAIGNVPGAVKNGVELGIDVGAELVAGDNADELVGILELAQKLPI